MTKEIIVIRAIQEYERNAVAQFVQDAMRGRYGSDAYDLPATVFVARRAGELVGVMAFSTSRGVPFRLERTYALDYDAFPRGFSRAKTVELGRWASKVPGVAECVLYAAICCALRHGYAWGIGEVKPCVARRFAHLGISVHMLSGKPILENIPTGARPYYLVPPPPIPAAIALIDARAALYKGVKGFILRGAVKIELA